jgi:hypothetical protein
MGCRVEPGNDRKAALAVMAGRKTRPSTLGEQPHFAVTPGRDCTRARFRLTFCSFYVLNALRLPSWGSEDRRASPAMAQRAGFTDAGDDRGRTGNLRKLALLGNFHLGMAAHYGKSSDRRAPTGRLGSFVGRRQAWRGSGSDQSPEVMTFPEAKAGEVDCQQPRTFGRRDGLPGRARRRQESGAPAAPRCHGRAQDPASMPGQQPQFAWKPGLPTRTPGCSPQAPRTACRGSGRRRAARAHAAAAAAIRRGRSVPY